MTLLTVLFVFGTVAAGALLGTGKRVPSIMLRLRQVLPVRALLSMSGSLYLLLDVR